MSQHDMDLANAAGAAFRADANAALVALAGLSSGATAPATTFAYMPWADTTSGWLKQRDAANAAWILRMPLGTGAAVDIASAATLDLTANAANSDTVRVTGTTTTTAITLADGQHRILRAAAAWPITHGASLICPGSASYTCTAGDLILAIGEAAGVVRLIIWRADGLAMASAAHGQCQLSKSGANLILLPKAGNTLRINGAICAVPDAGVTLSAPGTSGTTYMIYAYMSAGTMMLEASTTAHATSTTAGNKGVEIKSGDDTRTLVGMARTVSSAWVDSATQRFVLSYFNRRQITADFNFSSNRSTSSGSYAITNAADICEYLTWADEDVTVAAALSGTNSTSNAGYLFHPTIDGVAINSKQGLTNTWASGNYVTSALTAAGKVAEGYHASSIYYAAYGGGTVTALATYSSISAFVRG